MQELKDRIVKEGKVLPGNIIKVDGFLNHRVDTELMDHIAQELGRHFDMDGVDVILTAEASGIALAAVVARHFGKPMIFAKKAKSDNIEGGLYQSDIFSYTYKKKVTLLVSKEWLHAGDRVLVVDDFMANGEAMRGLCDIVEKAGAKLVGIGCAVEKGFQGGGDRLPIMMVFTDTDRLILKRRLSHETNFVPPVPRGPAASLRLPGGGGGRRQARDLPLPGGGDGSHRPPGLRRNAHLHLSRL